MRMNDSLLFRIVSFSLGLLLIVCPVALNAVEIDLSLKESDPSEMTNKERKKLGLKRLPRSLKESISLLFVLLK